MPKERFALFIRAVREILVAELPVPADAAIEEPNPEPFIMIGHVNG
jgi:hypothetical protein